MKASTHIQAKLFSGIASTSGSATQVILSASIDKQTGLTSTRCCWLVTTIAIARIAIKGHDRRVCSMFEQIAPENRSFSLSEAP